MLINNKNKSMPKGSKNQKQEPKILVLPRAPGGLQTSLPVTGVSTVCFTDLGKLNLLWRFKPEPIFAIKKGR